MVQDFAARLNKGAILATRSEILLAPVSPGSRLIEIGPSIAPIAPKSSGWNTVSIDTTTREGLVAKYAGDPGVDVSRIEPVDFVWTDGPLSTAVPAVQHGSFDAFIASHVIEHSPDLIAFLDAAATLVKPEGLVILAIPDKRYCFDYFQPLTTTGQLLEAHLDRRVRHARRFAFDHPAYAVSDGGLISWGQRPSRGTHFMYTLESAWSRFATLAGDAGYEDLHVWRFVPPSFELLMLELARLGQTDWRVERITPPDDCEFFVWLRRGGIARAAALSGQELGDQRMALLKRTLMAAQEQIDWSEIGQAKLQHVAALETELMETRARLDAILNSASWLVTRRLRRLLQKAPLPLQRALRQLLQPRGIPIEPPSPTSSARSSAASCART